MSRPADSVVDLAGGVQRLVLRVLKDKQVFREIRGEDGKLLFRLHRDNLRRLESWVRDGIKSIPHRGLEIGGLVTGAPPALNVSSEAIIDFVPVGIRYEFGPTFRAGEEDRPSFKDALAHHPPEGETQVRGYFRSHLTDEVEIREEDRWLLRLVLEDRPGFLILVQSARFQVSVIHIYAGTAGAMVLVSRFPLLELPADQVALWKAQDSSRLQGPPAVAQPRATKSSAVRWKSSPVILTMAAAVLAISTFALVQFKALPQPAAPPIPVELSLKARARKVEVTWNVASAAAKNAERGWLVIVDNLNSSRTALNAAELAAGKYEYTPVSGNLMFQIIFHERDKTFAGERRAFHVDLSAPAGVDIVKPGGTGPDAQTRMRLVPAENSPSRAGGVLQATPLAAPRETAPLQQTQEAAERAPSGASPLPAPALESMPDTEPVGLSKQPPLAHSDSSEPADTPVVSPATAAVSPPIAAPQLTAPKGQNGVSPQVVFKGPWPIKQVAPTIPPSVRSLLQGPISVRVLVQVNREGRVTDAKPAAENGGIEKLLAPHAVQAAKMWQFEPARRDGAAVASETVVLFEFARP